MNENIYLVIVWKEKRKLCMGLEVFLDPYNN